MSDCIFCQIIEGKAEVSTVYEDDTVISIMTIGPINPGHLMVIPRKHFASMRDMDEDAGTHLFKIVLRMEQAIRTSGVRCEGINLFLADGEAAFQDVFHLHMHIIPRFEGDPFKLQIDWSAKPKRDELDRVAGQIKGSYGSLWGDAEFGTTPP